MRNFFCDVYDPLDNTPPSTEVKSQRILHFGSLRPTAGGSVAVSQKKLRNGNQTRGYPMKSVKLTTEEVAERVRKHVVTVRLALSDKSLHGSQTKFGGRWLIEEDCAEAWARGEKCQHRTGVVTLSSRGRAAA